MSINTLASLKHLLNDKRGTYGIEEYVLSASGGWYYTRDGRRGELETLPDMFHALRRVHPKKGGILETIFYDPQEDDWFCIVNGKRMRLEDSNFYVAEEEYSNYGGSDDYVPVTQRMNVGTTEANTERVSNIIAQTIILVGVVTLFYYLLSALPGKNVVNPWAFYIALAVIFLGGVVRYILWRVNI